MLLAHYGYGRLEPPDDFPDFGSHMQWMHFAEGTSMYCAWAVRYASMVAKIPVEQVPKGYRPGSRGDGIVGIEAVLAYMDDFLAHHSYFGSANFSAADIMMHFVAVAFGPTAGIDSANYPHVDAWRRKIEQPPAYIRAMTFALPAGHDAQGNGCGLPIPFSNPPAVYSCDQK